MFMESAVFELGLGREATEDVLPIKTELGTNPWTQIAPARSATGAESFIVGVFSASIEGSAE